MTWTKLSTFFTPLRSGLAIVVTIAGILFGTALFYGISFNGPNAKIEANAAQTTKNQQEQAVLHARLDSVITSQGEQLRGLVRLACLDETAEKLALAGLTVQCRTLGVPVSKDHGISFGSSLGTVEMP